MHDQNLELNVDPCSACRHIIPAGALAVVFLAISGRSFILDVDLVRNRASQRSGLIMRPIGPEQYLFLQDSGDCIAHKDRREVILANQPDRSI